MATRTSDSQSKLAGAAKVVRLVDVKTARPEAVPPDAGIRPTREGPWDPCRFQEYEVSPEFRLQISAVKPPPADPSLFVETVSATNVSQLLASPVTDERAAEKPPRRWITTSGIKMLVITGAVLGLVIGFVTARARRAGPAPATSSVLVLPPVVPTVAPLPSAISTQALVQTSSESATLNKRQVESTTKAPIAKASQKSATVPSHSEATPKKPNRKSAPTSEDDLESAWVEPK